ncbi:DNA (cytosine-5-)-methyltransferase [Mycoplasma hafezii]|uniref:DNA (cytosine-5-)-methyltransferase n=1 Tax=Mycoplasma hafezii TaxID=525886 RepID=UPI003CF9C6D7
MKFFDFCAGIGGGRLGLEQNGLKCVGHSEIDLLTAKTYSYFFEDDNNYGDLTKIIPQELPNFDFLIAGFPCQTFSIVGNRKGFDDNRGLIIYYLANILKIKQPKLFLLENVKGLLNHDKGNTLKIILNKLDEIGYNVFYQVLNSKDYGVPQSWERIYLVGFRKDLNVTTFEFPLTSNLNTDFNQYLDDENNNILDLENPTFQKYLANKYNNNTYDINKLLETDNVVIDWRQSDLRVYDNLFPTLRTGRHGLLYIKNHKLHKLSGYEALLLQGFPKTIAQKSKEIKWLSNGKLLSQAGNEMTVNVISAISKKMLNTIKDKK